MVSYNLEKVIWTELDLDQMDWEGARIRACCLSNKLEVVFDLDYIFERVKSKNVDKYAKFWIAPCTLVFENAYEIMSDFYPLYPTIKYITRVRPRSPENGKKTDREFECDWSLHLDRGLIRLTSVGYKLYVRRGPVLTSRRYLNMEERGGISFKRSHEPFKTS